MKKEFVSFQADDKLEYIVKAMAMHHITSAPVLDDDAFIGVVSDIGIAEYFLPKKFVFLWMKNKPTPIEEIKKVTAKQLAKFSGVVLHPDEDLVNVLPKIVRMPYCIAVLSKKKLVGIINGEGITTFFLKELAKGEVEAMQSNSNEKKNMNTEIDVILEMVNKEGEIPAGKIAKKLSISIKTAEKIGESLNRHHLMDIRYSFFKGVIFRRLGHEKKY